MLLPTSCCPTCRLLTHAPSRACTYCGDRLVLASKLAQLEVSGVTALAKQPATGWRDTLALVTTGVALSASMGIGVLVFGSAGWLAGLAVGAFGYTKQYWRTAFKRRERVKTVAMPRAPEGPQLLGTAQPHERMIDNDALVVATMVLLDGGVVARSVNAVPFWLVEGERKILVDGSLWLHAERPERGSVADANALLHDAGIVLRRAERKRVQLVRAVLRRGHQVTAIGAPSTEQLVGSGYRDHLVDALRGQPRAPVWLVG